MTTSGKAIVAGATGMVGARLVERLVSENWQVVGLCRNPPSQKSAVSYLPVNLLDRAECFAKIGSLHDVTHLFYAARAEHGEGAVESVVENLDMLANVVEATANAATNLRHVHLVHGGKYYGQHLGPYTTPAKETQSRHPAPNFYYDQQDYVEKHADLWTWTIARPSFIYDFAPGRARNLISLIAVYSEISRELGMPLNFPGSIDAYRCLTECADVSQVTKAIVWMTTNDNCANQAFNITNGDIYRWQNVWPRFAEYFRLNLGSVDKIVLADYMRDKGPIWDRVVKKYDLCPTPYEDMALWEYGDFVFAPTYDVISDMTKTRQFGFHDVLDSENMFLSMFDRYREANLIP